MQQPRQELDPKYIPLRGKSIPKEVTWVVHPSTKEAWALQDGDARGGQLHFATVENLVYPWFQVVRLISSTHALLRIPAHPATKCVEVLVAAPAAGVVDACQRSEVRGGKVFCEMHWKRVCGKLFFLPVWFTTFDAVPVGDNPDVGPIRFPNWMSYMPIKDVRSMCLRALRKWYNLTLYARFNGSIPRMASAAGRAWRVVVWDLTQIHGTLVQPKAWGLDSMEQFARKPWLGDGGTVVVQDEEPQTPQEQAAQEQARQEQEADDVPADGT